MRYLIVLLALATLLLGSDSVVRATPPTQRWLVPNLINQPGDTRNYCCFDTLFDNPADYYQNMLEVQTWGFYLATVHQNPGNWVQRYVPIAQVTGLKTAIEGAALEQYGCGDDAYANGVAAATDELDKLRPLFDAGGQLDYIQMDSPFRRLVKLCGYNGGEANASIYGYIHTIHATHPETQVGITVDYPNWTAFGINNYHGQATLPINNLVNNLLSLINQNGERIAFIHADNPVEYMDCTAPGPRPDCSSINWWSRLKQLQNLVQSSGAPFGILYTSTSSIWLQPPPSNQQFYNKVAGMFTTAKNKGFTPDDYVFESWTISPIGFEPATTPYTYLWDANFIMQNARDTCNGVPGLVC